ncbi:Hypothetical predicted protein [Octopus vulgaris]|uniref:Uncharacterized protein n=1 Tax=Octopus vulgaris TaxID=6645 RepID=A0AA36AVI2_OCTVU|nr:Hypothetical predicted protein [Octopus vulgaris]
MLSDKIVFRSPRDILLSRSPPEPEETIGEVVELGVAWRDHRKFDEIECDGGIDRAGVAGRDDDADGTGVVEHEEAGVARRDDKRDEADDEREKAGVVGRDSELREGPEDSATAVSLRALAMQDDERRLVLS